MGRLVWLAAVALGIAAGVSAQAERLSDKDVKDLMEAIDKVLAGQFDALAKAYGTRFPIRESTPVRRLGDKEAGRPPTCYGDDPRRDRQAQSGVRTVTWKQ